MAGGRGRGSGGPGAPRARWGGAWVGACVVGLRVFACVMRRDGVCVCVCVCVGLVADFLPVPVGVWPLHATSPTGPTTSPPVPSHRARLRHPQVHPQNVPRAKAGSNTPPYIPGVSPVLARLFPPHQARLRHPPQYILSTSHVHSQYFPRAKSRSDSPRSHHRRPHPPPPPSPPCAPLRCHLPSPSGGGRRAGRARAGRPDAGARRI